MLPSEDTKIFEFNQYEISEKPPFLTYADFESLIEKMDECKTNPEKTSTTKVSEHVPSGFSISTLSWSKDIEPNHDV